MKCRFLGPLLLAALAGFFGAISHGQTPAPPSASSAQPAKAKAAAAASAEAEDGDFAAIRRAVEKYAEAYNSGNAEAIAGQYTANAELVDTAGTAYQGRAAIKAEYEAFFQEHPDASIKMVVEKVVFPAPGVAIEQGQTEWRPAKDQASSFSRYVAVHSKEADQWRLASVRNEAITRDNADNLDDLKWLIGQWVDEAPESRMEIDCYWHPSGAYLMRDFRITVKGLLASSGTERIGWDPLQQQVRSWLFDSAGGFLEGTWVRKGNRWTVAAHGYSAGGKPTHATFVVSPLRDDAYHLAASNRTVGRDELDNFEMTIVRRPPAPGNVPVLEAAGGKESKAEKPQE